MFSTRHDKLLVQNNNPDIEYLKMLLHAFFPMEERKKGVKEGRQAEHKDSEKSFT